MEDLLEMREQEDPGDAGVADEVREASAAEFSKAVMPPGNTMTASLPHIFGNSVAGEWGAFPCAPNISVVRNIVGGEPTKVPTGTLGFNSPSIGKTLQRTLQKEQSEALCNSNTKFDRRRRRCRWIAMRRSSAICAHYAHSADDQFGFRGLSRPNGRSDAPSNAGVSALSDGDHEVC